MSTLKERYARLTGIRDEKLGQKQRIEDDITRLSQEKEDATSARWVLSEVMRITQSQFKDRIENLVTAAIRSVFDRPFAFHMEFKIQRGKSECLFSVSEGDIVYDDIENELGGGMLDIIAFALRIVLWSMKNPKSDHVMIADEPFRFVGDYVGDTGQMLQTLSREMGLQFILITHEEELAEVADRAWRVSHDGKFSTVSQIK